MNLSRFQAETQGKSLQKNARTFGTHILLGFRILIIINGKKGVDMSTLDKRTVILGEYIVEHKTTVRDAAKSFGISKSTVHKDVSQRLKRVNPQLYTEVKQVLEHNKAQRHIRGGLATREKYLHKTK